VTGVACLLLVAYVVLQWSIGQVVFVNRVGHYWNVVVFEVEAEGLVHSLYKHNSPCLKET
jgi:hypothetical protein